MPYVKDYGKREEINFLASQKYTSFTYQVSDKDVIANKEGRKIVPAGTVYPSNDDKAIGILFVDVDVTEGPQPAPILVDAWILEARLPKAPTAEAKAAMKKISFKTVV
ncbi:hypothetical protein ABOUO_6 [Brevibacillus phage Abouo]|uniref:Head decoration protein n=2 Tax=Abouovirus TaxID=1984773 RepID=S5MCF0_9CAUD|nr:major head protein [Brevibacillus phage Davies]YP_009220063.1 major head protein [Brevibacillus phage Abouo]AGR47526.2 hypothetical protein ABOUO_6 [Brevibacillus phage Abouo]AGR47544.2 hypothetical protein DAVIES_6 [Brevibacillus phage Davies]